MTTASIYTLSDPRVEAVRYVGVTVQTLPARLRGHLRYKGEDHRTAWVQSLVRDGVTPLITLIDTVSADDRASAEQRWIAHYRAEGADLTNGTDGGEGCLGFKHSEKARAEMSRSRMGRPSPNKGKTMPLEQRELLRQATLRQYEEDPTKREGVSRTHKGKTISDDHKEAVSEANKKRWEEWRASGQQVSDETREKLRQAARVRAPRKPINEETRAKMAETRRRYWAEKRRS